MEWLVNRPNRVRAKQMALQAEGARGKLVYQRGHGNTYFRLYMVLWTAAMGAATFQLVQYARGKAKKVGE